MASADPDGQYLAGGTTQLDLMLRDGVLDPERLIDITRLPMRGITRKDDTLTVRALTTMEELAADPTVTDRLACVREAVLAGASTQLELDKHRLFSLERFDQHRVPRGNRRGSSVPRF